MISISTRLSLACHECTISISSFCVLFLYFCKRMNLFAFLLTVIQKRTSTFRCIFFFLLCGHIAILFSLLSSVPCPLLNARLFREWCMISRVSRTAKIRTIKLQNMAESDTVQRPAKKKKEQNGQAVRKKEMCYQLLSAQSQRVLDG